MKDFQDHKKYGVLAQLGARHIRIVEATGSNPVYSSRKNHVFTAGTDNAGKYAVFLFSMNTCPVLFGFILPQSGILWYSDPSADSRTYLYDAVFYIKIEKLYTFLLLNFFFFKNELAKIPYAWRHEYAVIIYHKKRPLTCRRIYLYDFNI